MSIDDLFNSNFFLTITISAVLISLLYLFVSNKLQEINGKMQTIYDIMRTLTNEVQMMKGGENIPINKPDAVKNINLGINPLDMFPDIMKNPNLIPIDEDSSSSYSGSEEEDDDDQDQKDEDEDDDDEEEEDDDESDDDEDEEGKEITEVNIVNNDMIVEDLSAQINDDIKVLNIETEVVNNIEDEYVKDLRKKKLPELKEMLKNKDPNIDANKLKKDQLIEEIVK